MRRQQWALSRRGWERLDDGASPLWATTPLASRPNWPSPSPSPPQGDAARPSWRKPTWRLVKDVQAAGQEAGGDVGGALPKTVTLPGVLDLQELVPRRPWAGSGGAHMRQAILKAVRHRAWNRLWAARGAGFGESAPCR
jgi:hypothetical protein